MSENNFDNDFEKLDPLSGGDDHSGSQAPEADLLSGGAPSAAGVQPLLDFSEPTAPPTVDSTIPEVEEPAAPVKEKKPASSSSSSGSWLKKVDPRVLDLIYWRDVKKTAVVFGSMLVLLLSLALFSVLSVIAYLSLATLTVTVTFRIYKNVLGAVQKTGDGHPFKQYLEMDIALPEDKVHELADLVMGHVTSAIKELRRLFLVEDFVDSLKFGLLLWVLTYIGAWFNGMTLLILGVVAIFSIPKVYETYKIQIDHYLDMARTQIKNVIKQIKEKIPLPGKKKPE
jgi:hypothetical protein